MLPVLPKLKNMSQVTKNHHKDVNFLPLQPPKLQLMKRLTPYKQLPNDHELNQDPDQLNFCFQSSVILRQGKHAEWTVANSCKVEENPRGTRNEAEAELDCLNNNWLESNMSSQTETVKFRKDSVYPRQVSHQWLHSREFKEFPPYILKNGDRDAGKKCEEKNPPTCTSLVSTTNVSATMAVIGNREKSPTKQLGKTSKAASTDSKLLKPPIKRDGKPSAEPQYFYVTLKKQSEQQSCDWKQKDKQRLSVPAWQKKPITDRFKVIQVHPYQRYDVNKNKCSQQNEDGEWNNTKRPPDVLTVSLKDLEPLQCTQLNQNMTRKSSDGVVEMERRRTDDNSASCVVADKVLQEKSEINYKKFQKTHSSKIITLPSIVHRCDVTINNELDTMLYAAEKNTMRKDCLDETSSVKGSMLEQNQDSVLDKSSICQSIQKFSESDGQRSKITKAETKLLKKRNCSTEIKDKTDFTIVNKKLLVDSCKQFNRYDNLNLIAKEKISWERKWCKLAKTQGNVINIPKHNGSDKEEQTPQVNKYAMHVVSVADASGSLPEEVGLQTDENERQIINKLKDVIADQSSSDITHSDAMQELGSSDKSNVFCGIKIKCLWCEQLHIVEEASSPDELLCFNCGQLQNICSRHLAATEKSGEGNWETAVPYGKYPMQASRENNPVVLSNSLSCSVKSKQTLAVYSDNVLRNKSPTNGSTTSLYSKTEDSKNIFKVDKNSPTPETRKKQCSWMKQCEAVGSVDVGLNSSNVLNMSSTNVSNTNKKEMGDSVKSESPSVHVSNYLKNANNACQRSRLNFTTVGKNAHLDHSCVQGGSTSKAVGYNSLVGYETSDFPIQKSRDFSLSLNKLHSQWYSKPAEKLPGILVYSQHYRKQPIKPSTSTCDYSNLYNNTQLLKGRLGYWRPYEIHNFKASGNGHLTSLQSLHSSDTGVTWSYGQDTCPLFVSNYTASRTLNHQPGVRKCPRNSNFVQCTVQPLCVTSKLNVEVNEESGDMTGSHESNVDLNCRVKHVPVEQACEMEKSPVTHLHTLVTLRSALSPLKCSGSFQSDHCYKEHFNNHPAGKKRSLEGISKLDYAMTNSLQQERTEQLHSPQSINGKKYDGFEGHSFSSSKSLFSSSFSMNVDLETSKMDSLMSRSRPEKQGLSLYMDDVIRTDVSSSNKKALQYVDARYLGKQICQNEKVVVSILKHKLEPALLRLLKQRNKRKSKNTPIKRCRKSVTKRNARSKRPNLIIGELSGTLAMIKGNDLPDRRDGNLPCNDQLPPLSFRRKRRAENRSKALEQIQIDEVSVPQTQEACMVKPGSDKKKDHGQFGTQVLVRNQHCQSYCRDSTTGLEEGLNGNVNRLSSSIELSNNKVRNRHLESQMDVRKVPNSHDEFICDENGPQTGLCHASELNGDNISKTTENCVSIKHPFPGDIEIDLPKDDGCESVNESFVFDIDCLSNLRIETNTSYNGAQVYMGWIDEMNLDECDQCIDAYDLKDPEYEEMVNMVL